MRTVFIINVFLIVSLYSINAQTVQQRLDNGETPCEITASGEPVESLYGNTYQGGLIFYLDTNTGDGLVALPGDQSTGALWGCWTIDIPGADDPAVGSGAQNTADILAGCGEQGIAAQIADQTSDGTYMDWFLPSKDELNLMYLNLKVNGFGGFADGYYWSSTESGSGLAWAQVFGNGSQQTQARFDQEHRVRPVRSFACQVVPAPDATIPTMSEWGLFLFGLIMLTVGIVSLYNFKHFTVKGD